jgi:superoxide dismutase, Cu-Zn family
MKRSIFLTVAALLSAGLAGTGCEQDKSSSSSSQRNSTKNETQQATAAAPTPVAAAPAPVAKTETPAAPAAPVAPVASADSSATVNAKTAETITHTEQFSETASAKDHAAAVAEVKPAANAKDVKVTGTVSFAAAEHGVKVLVDLKGLTPNGKHGFHIHEKGDLSSPDLKSAGPHFNPHGKKHGGPEGDERHGGDLGNITADADGNVKTEIMAHGVTINGEKDGVVGRSVIIHAKADDLKTDPSGDSGDRIAGGVIEKSKAEKSALADPKAAEAQPAAQIQPAELNK